VLSLGFSTRPIIYIVLVITLYIISGPADFREGRVVFE